MLDNVTRVTNEPLFPPLGAALDFAVAERPIGWYSVKQAKWYKTTGHKMLLRVGADKEPQKLAIVGDTYKVVHNRDLFPYIEHHMAQRLDADMLVGVTVREMVSYGGRDCYREYIFPNMKCDMRGEGDVAFRLIIGNSYGSKAVTLLAGAIDFWCSNGMIIGSHEKTVRKHTSGISLHGIDTWIDGALRQYVSHTKKLKQWRNTPMGFESFEQIKELLTAKSLLSARQADDLYGEVSRETRERTGVDAMTQGRTMWHLYSALTRWATHSEVRNTGNDHEANTRIERGLHVTRVMDVIEKHMDGV